MIEDAWRYTFDGRHLMIDNERKSGEYSALKGKTVHGEQETVVRFIPLNGTRYIIVEEAGARRGCSFEQS